MKVMKLCSVITLTSSIFLQANLTITNNSIEIKGVDCTATPDKVLFYWSSSSPSVSIPVLAKKFIDAGLRPVHIIIHNKREEAIVISAQSVGEQQPEIKEIIELFSVDETLGALVTLTFCGYFTGLANIIERKNLNPVWYPWSISFLAGSLGLSYYVWSSSCNQNAAVPQLIKKHILSSRMIIPPGAKRETIVLIDTSVSTNKIFFDLFTMEGGTVATFDLILTEGGKK